jgi:hypothetical protein
MRSNSSAASMLTSFKPRLRQLCAASVKVTFSEPTKYEEPFFKTIDPRGTTEYFFKNGNNFFTMFGNDFNVYERAPAGVLLN